MVAPRTARSPHGISEALAERDKNLALRVAKGFAPVIRRVITDAVQPVADRLITAEARIAELENLLGVQAKNSAPRRVR